MSIATEIERIKKAKENIINTLKAKDIQIEETATIDEVDVVINKVIDNFEVVVSLTEPTGENRKALWLQKGKNLYPVHFEVGAFYTENNGACGFDYSNYPIKKGKTYTFSTTLLKSKTGYNTRLYINEKKYPTNDATASYMGFYYKDVVGTHTFTAEKDGYFGLQIWKDDMSFMFQQDVVPGRINQINNNYQFMLEEGSTATEYEEYIEPKLYMLNENNEYVEVK